MRMVHNRKWKTIPENMIINFFFKIIYFCNCWWDTTLKWNICMNEWWIGLSFQRANTCAWKLFLPFLPKKYAWHIYFHMSIRFYVSYIPYSQKACVLDKWPPLPVTSYFSKNLFCRETSFSQNIIFHTGKQIWNISFLLLVLSDYHLLREGMSFKKAVDFWEDREVQL